MPWRNKVVVRSGQLILGQILVFNEKSSRHFIFSTSILYTWFFHDVSLHSTIMYDSKITPKRMCQKQWVRTCLKPVCPLFCDLKPFKIDNFFWTTKPGRTWILKTNLILHGAFHFASNLLHCMKLQAGRVKQSKNPLRDLQLFKGFRVCFFLGGRIFYFHASPCLTGFQPCTFSNGGVVAVAVSFLYNMLEGNNRVLSTWCGASLDRL